MSRAHPHDGTPRRLLFALGTTALVAGLAEQSEVVRRLAERILLPLGALHAKATAWILEAAGLGGVSASGNVVATSRFAIEVAPGCLSIPMLALLVVAMLVSGAPRRRVAWGVLLSTTLLILLNLVRLVHLFLMGLQDPVSFLWAHEVAWPAAMVAVVSASWLVFRSHSHPAIGRFGLAALTLIAASEARSEPPREPPPTYAEMAASDEAFRRFLETLPRQGVYYVLDGDIRMTETEVLPYLSSLTAPAARTDAASELIVNVEDGKPTYWADPGKRTLIYAIDRASFAPNEYAAVAGRLKNAARDWEAVCPDCLVRFVHRSEHDEAPSHDQVLFIVRKQELPGLLALAFFPNDPPKRRYLDIDPDYFSSTYDPDGVLRHELGHILGYRHERLQAGNYCYLSEEGRWVALTPYDAESVMHTPCQGVTQDGHDRFVISETDEIGHRELYGLGDSASAAAGLDAPHPTTAPVAASGTLVPSAAAPAQPTPGMGGTVLIRLEGGAVAENAALVANILVEEGLVGLEEEDVGALGACGLFHDGERLPGGCSSKTIKLAAKLNGLDTTSTAEARSFLEKKESLRTPEVRFQAYQFELRLDPKIESERRRLESLQKHWSKKAVGDPLTDEGGAQYLTYRGYSTEIRVESAEEATAVRSRLHGIDNVWTAFKRDEPYEKVLYGKMHPPERHWDNCIAADPNDPPNGDQGDYWRLFRDSAAEWPECARSCSGATCPVVVIADAPIAAHPDIAAKIGSEESAPSSGRCAKVDFSDDHHGTHLAGLVAAGDNGFGFVGMNPGASLHPYDWASGDPDSLSNEIRYARRPPKALFLFASHWDLRDHGVEFDGGFHLIEEDSRLNLLTIAKRIKELQPLWIAAAGQADPKGEKAPKNPFRIQKDTVFGPMNLGDLRNVVIVTACEDCSDASARLMPDANWSNEGLVHVAAPGKDVPGLATNSAYMIANGTSPAAALVAGVASAMLACYPDDYNAAELVKTRLQVTARPVLPRADADKIASGIVDPFLALKDPKSTWLVVNHVVAPGEASTPEPAHWCVSSIDPEPGAPLPTKDILRIVRYRGTGASDTRKQWVIYTQDLDQPLDHLGEVLRHGPAVLPKGPLVGLANGDPLEAKDLEDFIPAMPMPVAPC